jgi:hypothetical protein
MARPQQQRVAAIALDLLPLDACTKLLSGRYQFDRNSLLAGANEDDDVGPVAQARNIDLLDVLEINEQKFLCQSHLAGSE